MKKKLLFLLPAVAMVLAGCGGNPDTPTTEDPTSGAPTSQTPTSTPAPTSSTPYTPTHAGTEADPLDAVDAYNIASQLAESGSQEKFPTAEKYYVKDVVTSVTECSTSYGNATFSFGEPATPFTGYRLKVGESKAAITSEDQVATGDTVTIYSDLINFHGTMETNDGYIVSIAKPVASVSLNVSSQGVVKDSTVQLTATVLPEAAADKAVSWSVKDASPEGCVTVDQDGTVHGVEVGTAKVVVTTHDGNKTAECTITVTAGVVHVTSIALNKTSLEFYVNGSETLTATVLPDDATDKSFAWSIEDVSPADSIAVSDAGVVTSTAPGTARVIATTTDGALTAECTVTTTYEHGTVVSDPLTFAEMWEIAQALPHDQTSNQFAGKQYFISGTALVDGSHASTVSNGRASFYLSGLVGTETQSIQVYGMNGAGNKATFQNVDGSKIANGEEIIVAADIEDYYNSSASTHTLELAYHNGVADCYLVTESIPTGIEVTPASQTIHTSVTANLDAVVLPAGRVAADVTWSVDNETDYEIVANHDSVSVSKKDASADGTATLTATLSALNTNASVTFDVTAPIPVYSYTFVRNSSNNSYANVYSVTDAKHSNFAWSIPGNQYADAGLRLGGKNFADQDRVIGTRTAIEDNLRLVEIAVGAVSNNKLTVNSVKLEVYSTLDKVTAGGAGDVETVVGSFTPNTTLQFAKADPTTSWANCYYAIVFNMTCTVTSNCFLPVSTVTFSK